MSKKVSPKMVKRFNKGFIVSHWVNAISFFVLYLSALPMYTEFFDWLYVVFGGPENARLVHRIAAVGFMLPLPIMILFDRQGLRRWSKDMFTWKKNDFAFLKEFPKEFFGKKAHAPKQGFFNAGEKANSWLMVLTAIMLMVSGAIMWFPQYFSQSIIMWAYPVHNIGLGLSAAVVIAHIYMSVKLANPSLRGIFKGEVSEEYAKDHHGAWYDELKEEEKKKKKHA